MKTAIDYKKILNIINKNSIPIFFITPNPNRAIGFEGEIKNYHIVCSQNTDIINYMKKAGVSVFCLKKEDIKNSGRILEDAKTIEFIKEKSKGKTANIITFKPSPKIAKICRESNFRYIGNDWKLNRILENKIEFVRITNKLNLPNAGSRVIRLKKEKDFNFYFKHGEKLVVQLPRGFSGNSTFLVENKRDLERIFEKYKDREVKMSNYLKGETYTVNICISKFGTAISQPIFQITGLTSFNKNKLGTSGNDYAYAANLSRSVKKEIFSQSQKIANYIKKIGYKGIFGLDFIVSGENAHLIEINPRLVGSIPVFTKLQIQNEQTPFLLVHILEFLEKTEFQKTINYFIDSSSEFSPLFSKWEKGRVFNASQLILRNTGKTSIKIAKSLFSGIYEIKRNKPVFKKKAYWMTKNLRENELLIQCAGEKSIIDPDMEYANIQTSYGIMRDSRSLKTEFKNKISVFLSGIKLKKR